MAGTFLQRSRHGTVFYFRRRVPDVLRAIVGRPYLVKSLATEQRRDAIIRARALASKTDALFNEWRNMAKKDALRIDFALELTIDDLGRQFAKATDVKPGEETSAAIGVATLQAHLDGKPLPMQAPITLERPFGMTFADAIERYLDTSDAKSTSKSVYRSRLEHAQGHFGSDRDIRYIEIADLKDYKAFTIKTIGNVSTQGINIRQMVTFLNYMRHDQTWGSPLTTKNLIPKKETEDSEDRDSFTLEQLLAVFQFAAKFKDKEPAKYWATVAIAFTGCRIAELAQMNLKSDLHQDKSGVWFINVDQTKDSDGIIRKSLKNNSSKRKLPIHSALVKHGFIDYLRQQEAAGLTRPFENQWPVVTLHGQFLWGKSPTNWGSYEMRKLRKIGVLDDSEGKLSYFHSMRHTFSGEMTSAGIPIDLREAAMGHKYGSKDAERYAKAKQNPEMLSRLAYEPGLVKIAELLDRLRGESSPETAQGASQSI